MNLFNSMGNAWTADYLKITGELDVDLRSNIAAEARAKIVYERLINFCRDAGTKDALQFLMTREITHMRAFTLALESMGKPPFSIGKIAPTPKLVDQFFNDSTGEGDHGEVDARGPWNEGEPWEFVESPAFQDFNGAETDAPSIHAESSDPAESEPSRASSRSVAGHSARREAASQGAAEDGQSGALNSTANPVRNSSAGNRSASRTAQREPSNPWRTQREPSLVKEWPDWSRKARKL